MEAVEEYQRNRYDSKEVAKLVGIAVAVLLVCYAVYKFYQSFIVARNVAIGN